MLSSACGIFSQAPPESVFSDSEKKLRHGELDPALRQTEAAVRTYRAQPQSTWYWQFQLLRSEILLDRGRTAESLACLQELSALGGTASPELQAHLWLDLGDAKRRMGGDAESRKLFAQARELAIQQNLPALLTRIEIKLATSSTGDEAVATAQHALELARTLRGSLLDCERAQRYRLRAHGSVAIRRSHRLVRAG